MTFSLRRVRNGTPGLGLCHFNLDKNGLEAFRAFTVNSSLELYRCVIFKLFSFKGVKGWFIRILVYPNSEQKEAELQL